MTIYWASREYKKESTGFHIPFSIVSCFTFYIGGLLSITSRSCCRHTLDNYAYLEGKPSKLIQVSVAIL